MMDEGTLIKRKVRMQYIKKKWVKTVFSDLPKIKYKFDDTLIGTPYFSLSLCFCFS